MTSAHAKLCSPSGAEQWMACSGSVVMEAAFPDNSDDDTFNGTARHLVCGSALMEKKDAIDYVGREIVFWSHPESESTGECFREELGDNLETEILRTVTYEDDWVEEDQDYLDVVRAMAEGGEMFVEQRVNFERFTGIPGDSFGTADTVILKPLADTTYELIVVDRKTGYVEVPAERNKQLLFYALGAYNDHDLVFNITRARLVIHQREAREWDCSIEEVLAFAAEARTAAQRVKEAVDSHGQMDQATWQAKYLNPDPSRSACLYCRAMAECPAVQAKVDKLADEQPVTVYTPKDLATKFAAVGLIEDWCKAVRERVKTLLLEQQEVPGFKLVQGRAGNRKWTDAAAVETYLKDTVRLTESQRYSQKLISPTAAEKLFKEKTLRPGQWTKLQEHIGRADPSLAVVPEGDKRLPFVPRNAADDFSTLPDEPGVSPGK